MNTKQLRSLAEKATKGPFEAFDNYILGEQLSGERGKVLAEFFAGNPMYGDNSNDTEFYAACHPQAILALLDRLDSAREVIERLAAEVRDPKWAEFNTYNSIIEGIARAWLDANGEGM